VLIGILITLVTQSSSAGVATALVALHAGAISFPQACAMVIGMDVGTTFKSALAVLGGSTPMRRTGYAHVLYNLATGVMAFLLLPLYVWQAGDWLAAGGDAQFALVAFHTLFNMLGVILILPFTNSFARFVMRLVPEEGAPLVDRLDERLLASPSAALDAAIATLRVIALELAQTVTGLLGRDGVREWSPPVSLNCAMRSTRHACSWSASVPVMTANPVCTPAICRRCICSIICNRLLTAVRDGRASGAALGPAAVAAWRACCAILPAGLVRNRRWPADRAAFRQAARHPARPAPCRARAHHRPPRTASSAPDDAVRLDAARWLHRTAYHLWRIAHHLAIASGNGNAPARRTAERMADIDEEEPPVQLSWSRCGLPRLPVPKV
jgi:phosphate:Na+ symporter